MPTPATSPTPARAVRITLHRAEGPVGSTDSPCEFAGDNPWVAALGQLRLWSFTAPDDGSVYKTDFTVVYDDGFEYTGCFGLTSTDTDLAAHIRSNVNYLLEHRDMFDFVDFHALEKFRTGYEIGRA